MAFIYESGHDLTRNKRLNKKNIKKIHLSPQNKANRLDFHYEQTQKREFELDCLIGLSLIKKGVKYVNPEIFNRFYK